MARTPPVRQQHAVELVVRGAIPATELEAARSFVARLRQRRDGSRMATRLALDVVVGDLLDLDEEFHPFSHARSDEDVVVHCRDDDRIGLLYPRGSVLADEDDIVVAEPSRYSAPLALEDARAEMDMLLHRFLYFLDARDGRRRVLYLRVDGDYGLVQAW